MPHEEDSADSTVRAVDGLLGFAQGVLTAREKVQMSMQAGLGVFPEDAMRDLPAIDLDVEDGAWMRIARLRESAPPQPPDHITAFLSAAPNDPAKPPTIMEAIATEVSIEEASDLVEAGLLRPDNVRPLREGGVELIGRVRVILLAEDCVETKRDFERYMASSWSDWARHERPVRKSIALYQSLFKIHATIHTAEATPPEFVWGIGIGRWKKEAETVDMPLIEQQVDIEIEDGGAIAIRPRDLAPILSLKPYLELAIDGSERLQNQLRENFDAILKSDIEFSPFTTAWEPLLATAAAKLDSAGSHRDRNEIDGGAPTLEPAGPQLRIYSSWAIFGRPRSARAQLEDITELRRKISKGEVEIPEPLKGFALAPPELPASDTDDWGLNSNVLTAAVAAPSWAEPSRDSGADGMSAGDKAHGPGTAARKVHFFPLPYNEEQARIVDMVDDEAISQVTISGPPGTGKTHSIANIVSHHMAMGRRVLVTARTPEAIAAVREKLPEALRPLAIASTGTDRDSARQLQEAVAELSNQVIGMNVPEARERMTRLEASIVQAEEDADTADRRLADIARANYRAVRWKGAEYAPMELVDLLKSEASRHGWFTDCPSGPPPDDLDARLTRLRSSLPDLAPDMVYIGADLPAPEDIPDTKALIEAHERERARASAPIEDFSHAPLMARDTTGVDDIARRLLAELEACSGLVTNFDEGQGRLLRATFRPGAPEPAAARAAIAEIGRFDGIDAATRVRFDLRNAKLEDFVAAATRGAADQKPVGFGLFNGGLKEAVATVSLNDRPAASREDWLAVLAACRLKSMRDAIVDRFAALKQAQITDSVPHHPWQIAHWLLNQKERLEMTLGLAGRLAPCLTALRQLFPIDFDHGAIPDRLDFGPAGFALRANLPDPYVPPDALVRLRTLAGATDDPIRRAICDLADALGTEELTGRLLMQTRAELTAEIVRLKTLAPKLARAAEDMAALRSAGALDWAIRLAEDPIGAERLIPETWRDAWEWARMSGEVDAIVALGNGDAHRQAKAEALARRRKLLEELIKVRTLLGLSKRMTPGVKVAMAAFTEAVARIGKGTGKSAPRFRRAAQEAARRAAPSAPVWIMPEYKIPEQLPPEFGDFDLVILDEASQSDITAVSALARGKKILIVGDEEQVSPSVVGIPDQKINALRAEFLQGIPGADLVDQNTSIFAISKRMRPDTHLMLREHFRCVAPIIQFSTRYYQNRLIPLRVPRASERFDPPLVDVFVSQAIRQGKVNKSEAAWIVDEVAKIVADPANVDRDIGIISLIGGEQAERIGRMLIEDERIGPEKIEKHRIIYGDARTMQGQERSIVFLSMVATPSTAISQGSKADHQRMNVAMSRAADRLYLVRSVSLEDLKPGDVKADVLKHFADPMPDGHSMMAGSGDLMELCQSGFEREVLKRLLEANYRVRPQVKAGVYSIDLVVEGADDRRLAIELDGDAYHGPDVWEKDMARQAALERAGWTFWRVFGSQWRADPNYWWMNLVETLSRMEIAPIGAESRDERLTEKRIVGDGIDQPSASGSAEVQAPALDLSPFRKERDSNLTSTSPSQTGRDPHQTTGPDGQDAPRRPRQLEPRPEHRQAAFSFATEANDALEELRATIEPAGEDLPAIKPEAQEEGKETVVRIGSIVRLRKSDDGGVIRIQIVLERNHDPNRSLIGAHTALGEALIDATVGEDVEYQSGPYLRSVRVLAIEEPKPA
jgi:transcription elongation GreA/GreB family factor/very-short-patch-repair endonuclease